MGKAVYDPHKMYSRFIAQKYWTDFIDCPLHYSSTYKLLGDTPAHAVNQLFIPRGMSDAVETRRECEGAGRAGEGSARIIARTRYKLMMCLNFAFRL